MTPLTSDVIALTSRRVACPDGLRPAAILVDGDRISGIVSPAEIPQGVPIRDYGDLVLMPGLVDTHVHVNEPGRTEWEGFETATQAAAAGGITSIVDMPLNASPVTTTLAALDIKRRAAEGRCRVNCGFFGGLIQGNAHELPGLLEAGVLGIKAFLVDSGLDEFPPAGEADLRAAMPLLAQHQVPLLVHAELSGEAPLMTDPRSYAEYLASRPRDWEHRAIRQMLDLCAEYRCPVHLVHLSSADALPMLAEARASGLPITVETCPHYLYFAAEDVPDGDTRFKCAPPIRERENRERLWDGLRAGTIDTIGSDHSPCPPALKRLAEGDFARAWGGIASLQIGLPVVWAAAQARGFPIASLIEWMSQKPGQVVGLKNTLAVGRAADIVICDPDASFTVSAEKLFHRHAVTPYDGQTLQGVVQATYVGGQLVFDAGKNVGPAVGTLIVRN